MKAELLEIVHFKTQRRRVQHGRIIYRNAFSDDGSTFLFETQLAITIGQIEQTDRIFRVDVQFISVEPRKKGAIDRIGELRDLDVAKQQIGTVHTLEYLRSVCLIPEFPESRSKILASHFQ